MPSPFKSPAHEVHTAGNLLLPRSRYAPLVLPQLFSQNTHPDIEARLVENLTAPRAPPQPEFTFDFILQSTKLIGAEVKRATPAPPQKPPLLPQVCWTSS